MNLGLLGAAIYGEIFIDQRSKRSHPNKAVDVVVCQTSGIDSGSRFINSGPALHNQSRGDCPLAFGLFPLPPGRLGCRRDRCRHRVLQRLVQPSGRPPLLGASPLRTGLDSLPSSRTPLLESSPLRTVHESFQSHSSGPANASLKETRLRDGNTLAMNPVVALWVK